MIKNKGLQNRFPPEIDQFWKGSDYGYVCADCKESHSDCTHHIISPTSHNYIKGKHNESIFNSCRLNNEQCHLYKPMQNIEKQKKFLKWTYKIVMEAVENKEYYLTANDKKFIMIYKELYD